MKYIKPHRCRTISEYHAYRGLPKPHHPLVSVIHFDELEQLDGLGKSCVFDFCSIALKRNIGKHLKFKYGQQTYDFDEGIMFFISPNQVFSVETDGNHKLSGWMLLVHPDYFSQTPLAKSIKHHEYFSYSANEALHLSDKEESTLISIFQNIQQEYHANIDEFSQSLIISQIELLLQYCDRYYHRQFITRRINDHQILNRLEDLFTQIFDNEGIEAIVPTVQSIAQSLNMSPNYLSSLLKRLTGEITQQHIQNKLIERAKDQLATTNLSVGEIAYQLGFEYPQSFSKFFKAKTTFTPLQFRQSFIRESLSDKSINGKISSEDSIMENPLSEDSLSEQVLIRRLSSKKAYAVLSKHGILDKLKAFDPIIVGTIPINIAIENSDIDIICTFKNPKDFETSVIEIFGKEDQFHCYENKKMNPPAVVATFHLDGFEIEVFGQAIPTKQQLAFRHLLIEQKLLIKYGEEFRQKIIELKRKGLKTEPAFAQALGLQGDPYMELLKFESED